MTTWSEGASREGGNFDFGRILNRYLGPDDLHDMDKAAFEAMRKHQSLGSGVMASAESVQRIRDPLSEEAKRNFGDIALEALERTDLYRPSDDARPNGL